MIDEGRHLQFVDEICRFCEKPSREGHPAGVIAGRWRCTSCGRWQNDEDIADQLTEQIEEA